jgi:hypothetical protein
VDGESACPQQGCGAHECKEHGSISRHHSLLFFSLVPAKGR